MAKTIIFTDGSSRGNPGPGGWGAIVAYEENRTSFVKELGGGNKKTTNNRMELTAMIEALEFVVDKNITDGIVLYTDSEYVKKGSTEWLSGWFRNNWVTSTKSPVLNKDLWQKVVPLVSKLKIEFIVVKGHAGISGNERCDVIATSFADGEGVKLFSGLAEDYKINLEITRQITGSRGIASSSNKNRKAYSYVSSINGVVKVHRTWAECEERVKGQTNARYKKVFSKEEEGDLVKSFTHR